MVIELKRNNLLVSLMKRVCLRRVVQRSFPYFSGLGRFFNINGG